MLRSVLAPALALLVASCSDVETVAAGRLVLTSGAERSPWTVDPTPTTVQTFSVLLDSTVEYGEEEPAPIDSIAVDEDDPRAYGFFGVDARGVRVVGGRSLYLQSGPMAQSELPLFFSRIRRFAEPSGTFRTAPGSNPLTAVLQGRYWITVTPSNGDALLVQGYDLLHWSVDAELLRLGCPTTPCEPLSIATAGWFLVVLGNTWGIWADLESGESADLELPTGLESFEELAGAVAVRGPDDSAYLVGPASTRGVSDTVLVVGTGGELEVVRTQSARCGAATTWLDGYGLVVFGGSDVAPAIERFDSGEFQVVNYPPADVQGSELGIAESSLFTFGGRSADGQIAPAMKFDLECAENCQAEQSTLQLDIAEGAAAALELQRFMVIGHDTDGAIAAGEVDWEAESFEPIELPAERRSAAVSRLPTGHLGVLGGLEGDTPATTLKLLLP